MGYRNSEWSRKFYWKQVDEIRSLLEKYVKQSDQISVDKYLSICEQLGQEPDPDKMPLEISDLPSEVQVAFFIYDFLEDVWDWMSGTYLGKRWSNIEYLIKVYEIEDPKTMLLIMKLWESTVVQHRADKAEQKRQAEKRRSAGGGKNYTHNVRG